MAKKPTRAKTAEQDVTAGKLTQKKQGKAKPASKPAKAPAARTKIKASAVTKSGSATASITPADIALRAYFICEKRQKLGIPGDSTSDWVEAERQLKAEAVTPSPE